MKSKIKFTSIRYCLLAIGMIPLQTLVWIPASHSIPNLEPNKSKVHTLPSQILAAGERLPAGKYKCTSIVYYGSGPTGYPQMTVGAYGAFTLDGRGKYQNKAYKTSGTYFYDAAQHKISFSGGKFDGYSAEVVIREDGRYKIVFEPKPSENTDRITSPARRQNCLL
jgi:hypothetical protein